MERREEMDVHEWEVSGLRLSEPSFEPAYIFLNDIVLL